MLLDDGRDEAGAVALKPRGDRGVEFGHGLIVPFGPWLPMMVSMTRGEQDGPTTGQGGAQHLARSEREALCDTLEAVGPQAPTLCDPWDAAMLAAHLVLRERRPDLAAGIVVPLLAGRLDRAQERLARDTAWPDLVTLVRTGPPLWSPTRVPALDDVTNTVEMLVHHEDILRGDGARGPRREPDPALDGAAWDAVRRMAPLLLRRVPVGVDLEAPGRSVVHARSGAATVRVAGEPVELLLVCYGRERVAEVEITGPDVAVAALRGARLGL